MKKINFIKSLAGIPVLLYLFAPIIILSLSSSVFCDESERTVITTSHPHAQVDSQLILEEKEDRSEKDDEAQKKFSLNYGNVKSSIFTLADLQHYCFFYSLRSHIHPRGVSIYLSNQAFLL